MKQADITALRQMNPSKHLYLKVVGKGEQQHLAVCKRNFCGRIWMWLGFSSSSMKRIGKYIVQNGASFKGASAGDMLLFKEKLEHYHSRHRASKITSKALQILLQASVPAELPKVEAKPPQAASSGASLQLQPPASTKKLSVSDLHSVIDKKFDEALPEGVKGKEAEWERLQKFLESRTEKDLVFFSTGWIGGYHEQVSSLFPGFVLKALLEGKKLEAVRLENPEEKSAELDWGAFARAVNLYRSNYAGGQQKEIPECFYEGYGIARFRSGPVDNSTTEKVLQSLEAYFEKTLKGGKQVVIEDYAYSLEKSKQLITLYNKLQGKYPGKISYLLRNQEQNLMTQEAMDPTHYDVEKAAKWTYYPSLLEITLENKKASRTPKEEAVVDLNRKFITSAPSCNNSMFEREGYRLKSKALGTKLLDVEITKFFDFLKYEKVGTHSIVYVCLGAGQEASQVWPGFVFQNLEEGKKVKTLLFEQLHCKFGGTDYFTALQKEYGEGKEMPFTNKLKDHYAVRQFLCGYPDCAVDTADPNKYKMIGNLYWPTKKQLTEARASFEAYLRKELKAEATVVLGEHRGGITNEIVQLYNQLLQEYPGKVKLVWGWGGCNLFTEEKITEEDCDPTKKSKPWTHTPSLRNCRINP
jgi:hypothetical protein